MRASHPTTPILPGRRVTAPIGITRCRPRPKQASLSGAWTNQRRRPDIPVGRVFEIFRPQRGTHAETVNILKSHSEGAAYLYLAPPLVEAYLNGDVRKLGFFDASDSNLPETCSSIGSHERSPHPRPIFRSARFAY